jgi:hypothetical protein
VGCNLVGVNAFLHEPDLAGDMFAGDGQAEHLFHPRRDWLDRAYETLPPPYCVPLSNSNGI